MDDEPILEGFSQMTPEEEERFSLSEDAAIELRFEFRQIDEAQGTALAQARSVFAG